MAFQNSGEKQITPIQEELCQAREAIEAYLADLSPENQYSYEED